MLPKYYTYSQIRSSVCFLWKCSDFASIIKIPKTSNCIDKVSETSSRKIWKKNSNHPTKMMSQWKQKQFYPERMASPINSVSFRKKSIEIFCFPKLLRIGFGIIIFVVSQCTWKNWHKILKPIHTMSINLSCYHEIVKSLLWTML